MYSFKHNFITKRIKFSRHLPEAQTIEWRIIASLVSYIRVLQTLLKYAKQEVLCENVFHRQTRNQSFINPAGPHMFRIREEISFRFTSKYQMLKVFSLYVHICLLLCAYRLFDVLALLLPLTQKHKIIEVGNYFIFQLKGVGKAGRYLLAN